MIPLCTHYIQIMNNEVENLYICTHNIWFCDAFICNILKYNIIQLTAVVEWLKEHSPNMSYRFINGPVRVRFLIYWKTAERESKHRVSWKMLKFSLISVNGRPCQPEFFMVSFGHQESLYTVDSSWGKYNTV